ncbi:mechanosensitive ion channel family protein [Candidatus Woesearchaeota archaeon]|nr:mechanosensitive ion channel family protein [Candidatus Woesearchaeota archaeon]
MEFSFIGIIGAVTYSTNEVLNNRYIQALGILLGFIIVATIVYFIFKKVLLKLTLKTKTDLDDTILKKSNIPVALIIFFIGMKTALLSLNLDDAVRIIVQHIISTLLVLITGYLFVVIFDAIIQRALVNFAHKTHSKLDDQLMLLSRKTIRFVVFILIFMFVLQVWGVKIGPLLASLGIAGIAVAFGLQNTLGNIFGGVSLILDRSIRVGDVVKLDEDTSGEILDVGLRATRLRTWNNEVIIIPNGQLANTRIKNYVLPNTLARIEVPFSVAYGSDVDKVKKVVMGEIKKLTAVDRKRLESGDTKVMFTEMGASSLNFKAQIWLTSYEDRFVSKESLNTNIYNAFAKNKITIPFPQMDVHFDVQKKGQKK